MSGIASSPAPPSAAPTGVPLDDERWAALLACLRTLDYPARRDDLLRVSVLDRLPVPCVESLRALPDRAYTGVLDIVRELRGPSRPLPA